MRIIKRACLSFIILFFILNAQAQHFKLTGKLQDSERGIPVQAASVILRSFTDTLQSYTTYTDSTGQFQIDELVRDSFRIIFTSVGYETLTRSIKIDSADADMGIISLPRTSKELTGVTVTAGIPPAQQKGDTVQFNASQFKVNPDASAEDLARKIPGITIEGGQVKAQGENVRRVTIDGRELFGDDATAALRNLPAEVIDKIQVFDRLSDQAQFTGFDDGNTSKEINIITKANMRNGQFGRAYTGYGTDNRYHMGGNATIFKEKRRISVAANFNNINQQNFSQLDLLGVTSNASRGGGGTRGGGGGTRGGSGNRTQGGGNQGGGNFGNTSNFLVGQQNGINRTNAVGINFSDVWGTKATVSASYFFNNTNNNTDELSNRQYYLSSIANLRETNFNNSNNTNHRFNMRLEYRIDSSNQIIITPNLSFQHNKSDRERNILRFFGEDGSMQRVSATDNNRSSNRNGNNLNNTILYRHSFPKRGRTFSINLNTSYNKREGDTYLETQTTRYTGTNPNDTLERRFTDQFNNGWQVSTNVVYTEPISKNSQLQFNYNPTFSKSTSDQETFRYNHSRNEYSLFDTTLSNQFENKTRAQNAGISFRSGTRERQLSFGLNFQQTTLSSDQTFPRLLEVNKTFNNILPNAMFRYNLNPRTNIRLFYRTNINTPSVSQLASVADITNRPFISIGNPNLERQYTNVLSGRYTHTNTAKGILLMANVFWQRANNYITNATYVALRDSLITKDLVLRTGEELIMPVNLDGYNSLRSFLTFAFPLKFIKSNFNLNGGVTFSRFPGITNNLQNQSTNLVYSLGSALSSNISQYVDFNLSYSANFNNVNNELVKERNDNYFQHIAGLQLNLLAKTGWFFQNELNHQLYNGLTQQFNQSYMLWNMSAGKKLLKDQKGELRLSVFDLLKQNRSIARNINESFIEDSYNEVLRQYFMLTFTYNLRNFGTPATRAANQRGGANPRF